MKTHELRINLLVPLNKRRTRKQLAELQTWIAETLEARLNECAPGDETRTDAEYHEVGSMILTSHVGTDEVSA